LGSGMEGLIIPSPSTGPAEQTWPPASMTFSRWGSGSLSVVALGAVRGHQDSFAQEVEVGTAIHLPFEHLDAVDVAFHRAGVPGAGQARGDGVEVVLDAGDEGVQAGQADGAGLFEPSGEPFTAAAGQHDREGADAVVQGVQFRAAAQQGAQL